MIVTSAIDLENDRTILSEEIASKSLVCIRRPEITNFMALESIEQNFKDSDDEDLSEEEVDELHSRHSESVARYVLGLLNYPCVIKLHDASSSLHDASSSLVDLISGIDDYVDPMSVDVYTGRDIYIIGSVPQTVSMNHQVMFFEKSMVLDPSSYSSSFCDEFKHGMIVDLSPTIFHNIKMYDRIDRLTSELESNIEEFRRGAGIPSEWNRYADFVDNNFNESEYAVSKLYNLLIPHANHISFPAKLSFDRTLRVREIVLFNSLTRRFGEIRISGRPLIDTFCRGVCKRLGLDHLRFNIIGKTLSSFDAKQTTLPAYLGVEKVKKPEQISMLFEERVDERT